MKTAADYIDEIRSRYDLNSDRKAAALLGLTNTSVSKFRHGESAMSEETALKVAELLDTDPEEVLISARADAANDPAVKASWERLAKRAGYAACIACTALAGMGAPAPAEAATQAQAHGLYYVNFRRRCRGCPLALPVTSSDATPARLAA